MRYPIHTVGKQKESAIVSTEKVSMSHEDYLEAIVMLGGTPEHPVRSVDVATKLGVSKASVSKAISSLKAQGLLDQPFYGDITLTPAGYEYGSAVLKRHEDAHEIPRDQSRARPEGSPKRGLPDGARY